MLHSIDHTIQRIRDFRKIMGYKKFRLATLAGLPESTIRKIDSNEWNPTLETLKKLDILIPTDFSVEKYKKPKFKNNRSN